MKIAIVEDDLNFMVNLKELLLKYLPKYFNNCQIDCISKNYYIQLLNTTYDIVFMDIDLKDMSGISLVHQLKKSNFISTVIFVSARNDLSFDAMKVQPFDFVRKSNLNEDLLLSISLLNSEYKRNSLLLTLDLYGRKTGIYTNKIIYIQSDVHEINIITNDEIYTYRSTIKNILAKLNCKYFVQIQKSIVINFDHIREVTKENDVILINGNVFTISRHYKKEFLVKYEEYLLL